MRADTVTPDDMTLSRAAASEMTAATRESDRRAPARSSVGLVVSTAVLARRKVSAALRSGDVVFAVFGPVMFFVCFYVPLHRRFEATGFEYAQFLAPIILLQAGIFTAISATQVAGDDARAGVHERLVSLPIPRVAPILGRLAWVLVRMIVSLAAGLLIATALGFRFSGGPAQTVAFCALVILFGTALSMITDAIGTVAKNSLAVANLLMIPQLILVMASTGLVPAEGFPGWAQPFVRNQPLSVFADALRGLSTGTDFSPTTVTLWAIGLPALGIAAVVAAGRKQVNR